MADNIQSLVPLAVLSSNLDLGAISSVFCIGFGRGADVDLKVREKTGIAMLEGGEVALVGNCGRRRQRNLNVNLAGVNLPTVGFIRPVRVGDPSIGTCELGFTVPCLLYV